MQMYDKKFFEKAVEVKPEDLAEIEKVLKKYLPKIEYGIVSTNEKRIVFDDLVELMSFNNEKHEMIEKLIVEASDFVADNPSFIHISFVPKILNFTKGTMYFLLFSYTNTIQVEYLLSDKEKEVLMLDEIMPHFERMRQDPTNSLLSKLKVGSIFLFLLQFPLFLIALDIVAQLMSVGYVDQTKLYSMLIVCTLFEILLLWGASKIDKLWQLRFPAVIFLIGDEVKRDKFRKKLNEKILFGIGISFIVSLAAAYFFEFIRF